MLKRIVINNFQCHKHMVLDLSGGVDAIASKSDTGKSAILRAIYWVVFNRPLGDSFRRHGTNSTEVSIQFDNGITITRHKSTKDNYYEVCECNTDCGDNPPQVQKFEAMGGKVPEIVQKMLSLNEINFSQQMDAPFFLSMSPGEAAKYLNDVVGLSVIDSSLTKINSIIREDNQKLNYNQEQLSILKKQKEQYSYIIHAKSLLRSIKTLDTFVNESTSEIDTLCCFIKEIDQMTKELEQLKKRDVVSVSDLETQCQEINTIRTQQKTISSFVLSVQTKQNSLNTIKTSMECNMMTLKEIAPDVCPTCLQPINKEVFCHA